ncbi:MAG: PAS domain-containing protein [Candidatus Falkowbacteria bacterium]|nr:PAS domain-containing protein [Candidatus Falkowbacteria bacterium]
MLTTTFIIIALSQKENAMNSSLSMLSGILDAANANSPTGIIFNMLAEGVFITDSKLSIQYANERFYGLTRLSPQSIDENLRSLLEFNGFSRAEIWKDVLKDGSWNGNIQVSTEGQGEDHELFKIAITTIWDENHQEIYFCVGTIEDITFTKLFHTQRTASPEIILTEAQFQEKLGQSIQHKRKSDQAKKMGLLFISVEHSLYGVISNEEIHNIIGLAIRQLALECRDEDIIGYSSESTVFILLTNITEIQHLPGKAERIAKGLVKPIYSKNGTAINLSVCMGISIYPDDSEKTETLIRYSQLAAVRAKSTDKSWAIFSSEMESLNAAPL